MLTVAVLRRRMRFSLGIFIALSSLAGACSSDGGTSVDVEAELAADDLVPEYASRISRASGSAPSLDPQSLGAIIAAAIDDMVALSDKDFRDAGGISRWDLADAVGTLMGRLAIDLGRLGADNGRQGKVDATAYSLELIAAIASQSASGPRNDDDRLAWLVPDGVRSSGDLRDDLLGGDFDSAAARLVDKDDDFGPFDAIVDVEERLEQIVPSDEEEHPRDDLRRAFRFTISLEDIAGE